MSIVKCPPEISDKLSFCAICCVPLSPDKATAGLYNADNHQVFACVSHFSEVEKLILGWADFVASERKRYLEDRNISDKLFGDGGGRAWFDS